MTLTDYLAAAARRRWEPGVWDCCCFPAEWVLTWGLGDPMAEWRGAYATDDEALALIEAAGGLEALWSRGMEAIGVRRVDEPRLGDVGVIEVLGAKGPEAVGAIFAGPRWTSLAPRGLFVAHAQPLAVWGRR